MKNRTILSRINAKSILARSVIKEKAQKKDLGKIVMKDFSTGDVVKEFDSIEQAVSEGFNLPNIVGAIKKGNKYKGHLWTTENELT